MVVHIVMFKFKEENREENIKKVTMLLEELPSKISKIRTMEVGRDFSNSERSFDMSLYSTFESVEDLKAYAVDESHLHVVEFIKKVTVESKVVDYFK
ncbi:MAG: Dabb family protein [Campylobacterota bacterium]|nr:Dabb family protein [Campylobacterota bacterium]